MLLRTSHALSTKVGRVAERSLASVCHCALEVTKGARGQRGRPTALPLLLSGQSSSGCSFCRSWIPALYGRNWRKLALSWSHVLGWAQVPCCMLLLFLREGRNPLNPAFSSPHFLGRLNVEIRSVDFSWLSLSGSRSTEACGEATGPRLEKRAESSHAFLVLPVASGIPRSDLQLGGAARLVRCPGGAFSPCCRPPVCCGDLLDARV